MCLSKKEPTEKASDKHLSPWLTKRSPEQEAHAPILQKGKLRPERGNNPKFAALEPMRLPSSACACPHTLPLHISHTSNKPPLTPGHVKSSPPLQCDFPPFGIWGTRTRQARHEDILIPKIQTGANNTC